MRNKDFKRHIAYEALVIMGILALLLFICRLWPILLLVILGILIAVIRLLFLSQRKVAAIEPIETTGSVVGGHTEQDVQNLAFSVIQQRITCLITESYPEARWVWKTAQAKRRVLAGENVHILLNRAGGYREAIVHVQNLCVTGLTYCNALENVAPSGDSEATASTEETRQAPVNFEYLAFEWVDAHVVDLNTRCNECVARGESAILLTADELPDRGSWPDICRELVRNGIEDCQYTPDGIQINMKQ